MTNNNATPQTAAEKRSAIPDQPLQAMWRAGVTPSRVEGPPRACGCALPLDGLGVT
jgi:hypothetical protein